jgi:two-component system, OmpR family, phosphate regulon response regulator PhoB
MTTVFLVDDSLEIGDFVATFLRDEGMDVTTFVRAEAVLPLLHLTLPDLLILDGRLPGMSGWQCLDLLRASDRTNRLPVLLLTAALDDLQRATRPPDECTTYFSKPFDLDDFLAAIRGVIESCTQEPVAV